MFEKQRQIVAMAIRANAENARSFEEVIEKINRAMTISAICQEIGMQALFAAATMGAATYLTGTARMAAAGRWLEALGAEGNAATRLTVGAVAYVGGVSRGATGAEALTGVLSRAASGVVILVFRRMTGDLFTQDPMNFKGMGGAIFLTVLIAWAGSPGAPRANITPLKKLVEKLPTIASTQGGAQLAMPVFVGVNAWMKDRENHALAEFITENRAEFDRQLEQVAEKSADAVLDWAAKTAQDVAKNVGDQAAKIDYAKRLPFFARTFDFVGNAETLRDMSIQAAVAGAETEFWIRVSHCFMDLEQAIRAGKQIGK